MTNANWFGVAVFSAFMIGCQPSDPAGCPPGTVPAPVPLPVSSNDSVVPGGDPSGGVGGGSAGGQPVCIAVTSQPQPLPPGWKDLVEGSSCDILPEVDSLDIVGTLAHRRGYPRLAGDSLEYNVAIPYETPDSLVIRWFTQGETFENEVHDCQRLVFINGNDSTFGPLVGLLPLDGAMNLPDVGFDTGGVVIATVYNWGDVNGNAAPYDTLGIGDGWNCLWIRRSAGQWKAAMTADDSVPCFQRPSPAPALYDLDVRRAVHADAPPKTARWGWNASADVHTIGVKCGEEWCWVGPPGLFANDVEQLEGPPYATIPGYFDEQHLAVWNSTKGELVPGPFARVGPTPGYYDVAHTQVASDQAAPFFANGNAVAKIEIPGLDGATPEPYATQWGSSARPVILHLQQTAATAQVVSTFRSENGDLLVSAHPRVIRGGLHSAVGTIRWRWHDTKGTETIWNACGVKLTDCCDTDNRQY